ncbi:MAG: hypothetical protein EA375_06520 [Acholeplasmataceae bacterium]|nr:MAG: hypothetical protein EA375_06520 [Acholeplasmataceae bacterium]
MRPWRFLGLVLLLLTLLAACNGMTKQVTITFVTGTDEVIDAVTIGVDAISIDLPEPVRDGYVFTGWTLDEEGLTPFSIIHLATDTALVLYAQWEAEAQMVTITFETSGGTLVAPLSQVAGSPVNAPEDPELTGYMFADWYRDEDLTEAFVFDVMPDVDMTVYAKFVPILYTITLMTNHGSDIPDMSAYYDDVINAPADPDRDGYAFGGWYEDADLTMPFVFDRMPANDLILYARWMDIEQTRVMYYDYDALMIADIAIGGAHTIILTHTGLVFVMGENLHGQLGLRDRDDRHEPVPLDWPEWLDDKVVGIAAGEAHTLVLTESGRLFGFGNNDHGQCGMPGEDSRDEPFEINHHGWHDDPVVMMAAGRAHSLVLTVSGKVYAFGANDHGQLGDGSVIDRVVPIDITASLSGTPFLVAAGADHSYVITDVAFYVFGRNDQGQLGTGDRLDRAVPTNIRDAFDAAHHPEKIRTGAHHTVVISTTGIQYGFGANDKGQLAHVHLEDLLTPVNFTVLQDPMGWGMAAIDAVLGSHHSIFIYSGGMLFGYGQNHNGALGTGEPFDAIHLPIYLRSFLGSTLPSSIGTAQQLWAGHDRVFLLDHLNKLHAWGGNAHGQLGTGDVADALLPTDITPVVWQRVATLILSPGEAVTHPLLEARALHDFAGWYVDIDLTAPVDDIDDAAGVVMLYAKWMYAGVTITFDTGEWWPVEPLIGRPGTDIPYGPYHDYETGDERAEFMGWYLDDAYTEPFGLDAFPAEDITVYARFESTMITITFETYGGDPLEPLEFFGWDEWILPMPLKEGHIFAGWYLDEDYEWLFDEHTVLEESLTLHASWVAVPDGLLIIIEDDDIIITGYDGSNTTLFIPGRIGIYDVTTIAAGAFEGLDQIVILEVADGIRIIGNNAFRNMTALVELRLPYTLTTVGTNVAVGCPSLEMLTMPGHMRFLAFFNNNFTLVPETLTEVIIADGSTSILTQAFEHAYHVESLYIPRTVHQLGQRILSNSSIAHVHIESTSVLTTIHANAFDDSKLVTINIPASVTWIQSGAFMRNNHLTTVTLAAGSKLHTIQSSAFSQTPLLESFDFIEGLTSIGSSAFADSGLTSISLPSTLTHLGDHAFRNNVNLLMVDIHVDAVLTMIPRYLFEGCTSLVYFTLPDQVEVIEEGAFRNATNLQTFVIGEGSMLTVIGDYAFEYTTMLTTINLPDGVTDIGEYAFRGASALQSLTLPAGLSEIKRYAFAGMSALTTLHIPENIITIHQSAFIDASSLVSLTFAEHSQLLTIGYEAFRRASSLEAVVFPRYLDEIQSYAFEQAYSLQTISFAPNAKLRVMGIRVFEDAYSLTSVTLPASLEEIGGYTFAGAYSLTSVTFEAGIGIDEIPGGFVSGATALTGITLPDGIKRISGHAFELTGLTTIHIPASVEEIQFSAFSHTDDLDTITFALGNQLERIGYEAFAYSGLTTITIPAQVRIIEQRAFAYADRLANVVFESGSQLEIIENAAFVSNHALLDIVLPEGLHTLGTAVFLFSENLTSITFPDSLYRIGSRALADTAWFANQPDGVVYAGKVAYAYKGAMPADTHIEIVAGTKGIAGRAFYDELYGLPNMVGITLPEGLLHIGNYAFWDATGLVDITIPDSVHSIGEHAFLNTAWLSAQPDGVVYAGKVAYTYKGVMPTQTTLTLRADTIGIADHAFSNQINLWGVILPEGLTTIGRGAFGYIPHLSVLILPSTLESIGQWAFVGCQQLLSVTVLATTPPILGPNAFLSNHPDLDIWVPADSLSLYQEAWASVIDRLVPIS